MQNAKYLVIVKKYNNNKKIKKTISFDLKHAKINRMK